MTYDVVECATHPDEWRVEAIDFEDEGTCYLTLFTGPDARERATEYAAWKYAERGEGRR